MNPRSRIFWAVALAASALLLQVSCGSTGRGRRAGPAPIETALEDGMPAEAEIPGESAEPALAGGPRSAADVARRALVLRCLGQISLAPRSTERAESSTMEYFEGERQKMVAWMRREKFWSAATPREQAFLSTHIGTHVRGSLDPTKEWREELSTALWALGGVKRMPGYDEPAAAFTDMAKRLPRIGLPTEGFIQAAQLRAAGVILHERQKAEMWQWRALAWERMARKDFPEGEELRELRAGLREKADEENFRLRPMPDGQTLFLELIRFSSNHAYQKGLIQRPIQEDFPAFGKRYSTLRNTEVTLLKRYATERLDVLLWMMGEDEG
jgi:hypothetical protein